MELAGGPKGRAGFFVGAASRGAAKFGRNARARSIATAGRCRAEICRTAKMWPLDVVSQFFRQQTVFAGLRRHRDVLRIAAIAGALWLSGPAIAGDTDDGEKLIGTFTTRPGAARDDGRAGEADSGDRRGGARAAGGAGRRNFLTGETSVSHSVEDTFLRDAGDRIFFGSGSAEIGTRARTVLSAQAEWLKRHPVLRLTIEGHADDGGTGEQNVRLSVERAEAVRDRLVAEGVEARRIAVVARGREDRVAVCADPGCMAQNRRTVTLVHASGAGERIGFDRQRATPGVAPGQPDTGGGRKGPVPR